MRVSECPRSVKSRACRENAYLEWMTCLSCGARWSRTTGVDDIHMKKRSAKGTASVGTPVSWMWEDDATATSDKQDGDVFRVQSVHHCGKGVVRVPTAGSPSVPSCSGGATLGESGNANRRRISQFRGELQHVERSNRVTARTGVPAGATPVSFVFWNHGSEGSQKNRPDVSRATAEGHGVQRSQNAAGDGAEDTIGAKSLLN